MSKPRIRVGAEPICLPVKDVADENAVTMAAVPAMLALPEEFTQPKLAGLYADVSARRAAGTFLGLDGSTVKRTDGAGVQFLLACMTLPAGQDAGADESIVPALVCSESLLGAIAAMGARDLLDACLSVAATADASDRQLAA